MRQIRIFPALLVFALALALAACRDRGGGSPDGGIRSEIRAEVADTAGKPIANAWVNLTREDGQGTWVRQTDEKGVVRFEPGILASFRLSVGPPPGYSLVDPAQASVPLRTTAEDP